MAPLREINPAGLYHVWTRGNYKGMIFHDVAHFERYLKLLDRIVRKRGWLVLDWCLMPNHYHLLIQLTEGGLSEGMRELNGCFSRWSNAVRDLTGTGHLVRNRFGLKEVESDAHLFNLIPYIALNPVKWKSLGVDSPEDWPWSGYRANAGLEHPRPFHRPGELLRYLDDDPSKAADAYRERVREGHATWSDQGYGLLIESLA
jgi:putative transposase